jgi:hypothetical protein
MGHSLHFGSVSMSGLPATTTEWRTFKNGRNVPKPDVHPLSHANGQARSLLAGVITRLRAAPGSARARGAAIRQCRPVAILWHGFVHCSRPPRGQPQDCLRKAQLCAAIKTKSFYPRTVYGVARLRSRHDHRPYRKTRRTDKAAPSPANRRALFAASAVFVLPALHPMTLWRRRCHRQ